MGPQDQQLPQQCEPVAVLTSSQLNLRIEVIYFLLAIDVLVKLGSSIYVFNNFNVNPPWNRLDLPCLLRFTLTFLDITSVSHFFLLGAASIELIQYIFPNRGLRKLDFLLI